MATELAPVTRKDLAAFRKDLAAVGPEWPKQVKAVNQVIATKGARRAMGRALSMGGVWARNASAIQPRATARAGSIRVKPSKGRNSRTAGAKVAFWGSKKRTGWYAEERFNEIKTVQHPPWVGNTWKAGVKGQGPYAINDALADYGPELLEDWGHAIDELTARAFPDR